MGDITPLGARASGRPVYKELLEFRTAHLDVHEDCCDELVFGAHGPAQVKTYRDGDKGWCEKQVEEWPVEVYHSDALQPWQKGRLWVVRAECLENGEIDRVSHTLAK